MRTSSITRSTAGSRRPAADPVRTPCWRANTITPCTAVDAGEDTLIDPYGAEDPAEFFAVATEAFFERSRALRARHAELYRVLADLYALDPAGGS